jgi:hypothetical protein
LWPVLAVASQETYGAGRVGGFPTAERVSKAVFETLRAWEGSDEGMEERSGGVAGPKQAAS